MQFGERSSLRQWRTEPIQIEAAIIIRNGSGVREHVPLNLSHRLAAGKPPAEASEARARASTKIRSVRPSGTVGFLFTDIEGSTARWERFRQQMAEALERHDALLKGAVERHGGYVFKTVGDAVCAAFPTVRQAVAAALDAQRGVASEDFAAVNGLAVRMAVHAGNAQERDGDYFGPAVNRTARLLSIGNGGQILLSSVAADLSADDLPPQASLRDLGVQRLKDLDKPERVYRLIAADLPDVATPVRSSGNAQTNLPAPVTPFIGRAAEIHRLRQRLGESAVLTLVGPGGVGKTRLALEICSGDVDAYADGVWFADFAPLADGSLLVPTVASLFRIAERSGGALAQSIAASLRHKTTLIVFDNCEHVLPEAAALADAIVREASNVRIVATSREALGISGEAVHRVSTLNTSDAVALFADRASAADAGFAVTADNAAAVADICNRLDGIPLAIELAATRMRALSLEQLASRLDERLRLLTRGNRAALPRQQTLRALIDWSHDLLSEQEQTMFRRISVFAGGWTAEAASNACGDDCMDAWDVLDVLSSLVEKSLVVAEPSGGELRYRLLESTRQYASERLDLAGERDALRERHAQYMTRFMREARNALKETPVEEWLRPLRPELDNLRLALDWLILRRHDVLCGAKLISDAHEFLSETAQFGDLWRWSEAAMSALPHEAPAEVRATLLLAMCTASNAIGLGLAQREALARDALECYRATGDVAGTARALLFVGNERWFYGNRDDSAPLIEEALQLAKRTDDRRLLASALAAAAFALENGVEKRLSLCRQAIELYRAAGDEQKTARCLEWLAELEFDAGSVDAALQSAAEVIDIARRRNDRMQQAVGLVNTAAYHLALDHIDEARDAAREALLQCRGLDVRRLELWPLQHLASVACARGDAPAAARITGYVDARIARLDEPRQHTEQVLYDRLMASLAQRLSAEELERHRAAGAALNAERAVAEALSIA